MKIKKIISVLLCFMNILILCSCAVKSPGYNNQETEAESTLRLVATSPAAAWIMSRLELELVGICTTESEMPEEYSGLPEVGMAMNPDMEILRSLSPDYIISPSTLMNDLQPKYADAGLAAIFLNLKSVEGMYASIENLGEKFNREKQAKLLLDEFDSFMNEYFSDINNSSPPTVLVLMGLPGAYIVATESSYVGNLVKLAGGKNVYGDGGGQEFLRANTEDMMIKDADVILRAAHAMPQYVAEMFDKEFRENDVWKHFSAVKSGRVYDLDPYLFNMSANFRYPDALNELKPMLYE